MSDNNIQKITNQQTITSLEIAEITGKEHRNVLRDIRSMEVAWEKITQLKFERSYYKDKSGKNSPMFTLTKDECLYVATKFNDEARAKLVLRWKQLEEERMQPVSKTDTPTTLPADPSQLTRKQLLLMALEAEEEKEKLQEKVEDLEADNYSLSVDNAEKSQQIERLANVW